MVHEHRLAYNDIPCTKGIAFFVFYIAPVFLLVDVNIRSQTTKQLTFPHCDHMIPDIGMVGRVHQQY